MNAFDMHYLMNTVVYVDIIKRNDVHNHLKTRWGLHL